jgi:hypothetical protein
VSERDHRRCEEGYSEFVQCTAISRRDVFGGFPERQFGLRQRPFDRLLKVFGES